MRDPETNIRNLTKKVFREEIEDLEKEGHLIIYRDIYLDCEDKCFYANIEVVKHQIIHPFRLKKLYKEEIWARMFM
jgi:hypothetical protein